MDLKCRRILYVERSAFIGGSVISLYELVRGLDTDLYEPIVLFLEPNPYQEQFRALGVKVISLRKHFSRSPQPTHAPRDIAASLSRYSARLAAGYWAARQFYLLVRQDLPLARRVARLIKAEAIDVVHHNNTLTGNRATVLAAWLAGVPSVCHVRMLHPLSFIEKRLVSLVAYFIYISRAVEQLYQGLGVPASQGQVVYNPINIEAFSQNDHRAELRTELGLTDQDYVISNVGRIEPWKGYDYFIQAMAKVVAVQPQAKALIVGVPSSAPASQAHYQQLQQLVKELHLQNHVIFTGFRSDIPRIMTAADLVVHSAVEPEPFGRVIVEGMATGRPVIATAAGGVLDIIEDKVTGWLVPPKDATAMARAIEQLLQNPEQAKLMGQRAQKRASACFSVNQHVVLIQQIYQRVLALGKPA